MMATNGNSALALASVSPTAEALDQIAVYGLAPTAGEIDHRPMPDDEATRNGLAEIFDVVEGMFGDTRLESDLEPTLWALVNLFHYRINRLQRMLDDNEDAQKESQREQDGSEVKSYELETLIDEGQGLIERRNAFEAIRDDAAALYEQRTGSTWRPSTGSMVSRRNLTASVIDSRDFINARRRAETELHFPAGPRIAFTGGPKYQNTELVWSTLDKVHAKHPDMVLMHGGDRQGADLIAEKWAEHRGVAQVKFRPDWKRFNSAAPFKRNDRMLEALPIGLVAVDGSGITDNLVDKARSLGIPVCDMRERGA